MFTFGVPTPKTSRSFPRGVPKTSTYCTPLRPGSLIAFKSIAEIKVGGGFRGQPFLGEIAVAGQAPQITDSRRGAFIQSLDPGQQRGSARDPLQDGARVIVLSLEPRSHLGIR